MTKTATNFSIILLLSLSYLIIQLSAPSLSLVIFLAAIILSFKWDILRLPLGIIACLASGHFIWITVYNLAFSALEQGVLTDAVFNYLQRLGLIGYLISFGLWYYRLPTALKIRWTGSLNMEIRMPCFFSGKKEQLRNFFLIYCSIALLAMVPAVLIQGFSIHVLIFGLIFSCINSIIEEIIWRKFILSRLHDIFQKNVLLLSNALLFGIYHLSLGFPWWTCLIFAIGGYYMAGTAYLSKGLIYPVIMHFLVNMVFVFWGMI